MNRAVVKLLCFAILPGFFGSVSFAEDDMGWQEQYAYMVGKQAYIYG